MAVGAMGGDAGGTAIELVEDRSSKTPAPAATLRVMEAARENRVLIGRGGIDGNVIRISPPLNISRSDVDNFIGALDASLTKAAIPALQGAGR